MKRKLLLPIFALLLASLMVTTIEAQSYLYKEVWTEHRDEIIDDEHWVGVRTTTMIVWSRTENIYKITVKGVEVLRLYKASTGELAAKIKFSMTYTGTMYDVNDWHTGTYVLSWVVIPVAEELIPEDDYDINGRVVEKYQDGSLVWRKERGEMWW